MLQVGNCGPWYPPCGLGLLLGCWFVVALSWVVVVLYWFVIVPCWFVVVLSWLMFVQCCKYKKYFPDRVCKVTETLRQKTVDFPRNQYLSPFIKNNIYICIYFKTFLGLKIKYRTFVIKESIDISVRSTQT